MRIKRILSVVLMLCVLLSTSIVASYAAQVDLVQSAAQLEITEVGKDYGLMDDIQDGNILHCFDWKYNDIKAMLPQIAEAGFTSVQTSPAQQPYETFGAWWKLYQPLGFWVGDSNPIGNRNELKSLCEEAEKYGIKVIVDVVANHLAGNQSNIDGELKGSQYWHTMGGVNNWGDRNQVIYGEIGMPDLNTGHSTVQQKVRNYILDLKSIGVDGIRWDAAKHIGLPSEGDNFWSAVTSGTGLYHYGEILDSPAGNENSIMREYTQYMSVTDNRYGGDLRYSFYEGRAVTSNGLWTNSGLSSSKMVYWAESHDTYSNNSNDSEKMSQNVIDRAYAVAGSRDGAAGLYFSRPASTNKDSILMGQKGSTHFTSAEVAAVNHFRNAMNGQKEYLTTGSNCTVVCREQGAVIVAGSGSNFSVSVPNGGSLVKPGTYTDEITGATWTVTSSTISGQIGSSGIAVIYNPTKEPSVSVSQKGGTFKTDTLSLTLTLNNATSGTYSVNGGASETFTGSKTITIGAGVAVGSTITLKVTATDGSTKTEQTYSYTKADPNASGIYFDNSQKNWAKVYCYIYNSSGEAVLWPGTTMTNVGNNIWFMDVPAGFESCNVIFTDGNGDQTPAAQESGFVYNDEPMIYRNGSWEAYNPTPTTPTTPTIPTVVTDPTEKPTTPTEPSGSILMGDVVSNGIINVKDATYVQAHVAARDILSSKAQFAGDVDQNEVLNVRDAAVIQKHVAGITTVSKVGKYVSYNGGTLTTDPTEKPTTAPTDPVVTQPVVSGKNIIYFNNTSGWSEVNAYFWGNDGNGGQWPGVKMTHVDGSVYKIEVDEKYDNIIFNTGGGSTKTDDLSIPGNNQIFSYETKSWSAYSGNPSDYGTGTNNNNNNGNTVTLKFIDSGYWGYVKAICWNNSNSQQRTEYEMHKTGDNVFEVQIPAGYDKVYFTNGDQKCQDQNIPANGGTFDYYTGWK